MMQQHFYLQKVCSDTGQTIPDAPLMPDTIFNNIKAARPLADEWEVLYAADEARVLDFAWEWPDGIHTIIGKGGVTLTYGEELCIRIARNLLAGEKVVLIHDPLVSVDEEEDMSMGDLVLELINKGVVEVITKRIMTFFWGGHSLFTTH